MKKEKLKPTMTLQAFNRGYWYATEIKTFARELGIKHHAKLRKDELEELIKIYLRTGKLETSKRRMTTSSMVRDLDKGLSMILPVINYTSNKITKDFIHGEALKIEPALKKKSGARYRLNRWREDQISKGKKITYGDLVKQYVKLNQTDEKFPKIESGRYINFLADFLKSEKRSTREDAIAAWHRLKDSNAEKNYAGWKNIRKR